MKFKLLYLLVSSLSPGFITAEPSSSSSSSTAGAAPQNDDSTQYPHFVAHNKTQTCTADTHSLPFNTQIRGVNLGGWLVLEPWITPSLFYQFLGKDENTTAIDIHSFCTVLGPEEGNKQLKRHWEAWVTQDIIKELAESGAVNSLRLPVGDWMYKPYGAYVGCTDGALDYVDNLLDWAYDNNLNVLIDIHGVKGSQNGFDNSGQAQGFEWTSVLNTVPAGDVTFEHWPIRSAGWMGEFDRYTAGYKNINYDNIQHALDVIQIIVDMYKSYPAVLGIEPVNEPWQYTPIDELKNFYWEGYLIVKQSAPFWKYIMHDSFRLDPSVWGGFMAGCPERALDTHIYQAWKDPSSRETFYENACSTKHIIATMERVFGPVIVGEWSLATDNCAMWLNGFNDNLPGFPRLPCKYIPCANPYMGFDQPGTPVDPGKPAQGPFGTGMSGPIFGLCPVGRDWLVESEHDSGKDWMKAPPTAPYGRDASDEVMTQLALKKINSFSGYGHGFYFWNFRTEIDEPHWSYMSALKRDWIPSGDLNDVVITNACHKEDNGLYKCIAKRDQLESNIRNGVDFVLKIQGNKTDLVNDNDEPLTKNNVANMTGKELYTLADKAYNEYWQKHRVDGITCDFGGTGVLVEVNSTIPSANDDDYFDDDEHREVDNEMKLVEIVAFSTLSILIGSILGFCAAMKSNKNFNKRMQKTKFGKTISRSFVYKSFGGFSSHDYTEIPSIRV